MQPWKGHPLGFGQRSHLRATLVSQNTYVGGLLLLRTGAAGGGLGGIKGARSPSLVAGSRLSSAGSFLGAGCTKGWSSPSSETTV